VALVAAVDQDGAHTLLEEADVGGVELPGRVRGDRHRTDEYKQNARV
jgi:hypothetical protein